MKKLIIIILSSVTLTVTAQSSKYRCLDSKCEFDKPIMPGGYYYGYAYSDYIPCDINSVKGSPEELLSRWQEYSGTSHNYKIYKAHNGTWKLQGSIYLCGNHSNKMLYFKPGNRYASGVDNNEPLELNLPQPKTWKVK
jgi:hypothetical protein